MHRMDNGLWKAWNVLFVLLVIAFAAWYLEAYPVAYSLAGLAVLLAWVIIGHEMVRLLRAIRGRMAKPHRLGGRP